MTSEDCCDKTLAAIKAAKFLSKKIVRDQAIELFRFTSAKMEGSNQFSRWVEA